MKERQSKAKEITHPLSETDQSPASVQTAFTLEENPSSLLLLCLLQILLLSMIVYAVKYPFDQFESTVTLRLRPLSAPWLLSALLTEEGRTGKKRHSWWCANTVQQWWNISTLSTLFQPQIQNTAWYRLLWRK